MTTFVDGPAKGQHLMLHRAVKFLRVVEALGVWDALDQPEDQPRPEETLYAYTLVGQPSMCHICSGKRGTSGFYAIAAYRLVTQQPTDGEMRSAQAWKAWCEKQP